jgi:CRISPR system Cascade subunit CasC
MTEFIQIHVLASYPPSNLNRDDLGRPKTAILGGTQRLRISSQSLKRAWRQSDLFQSALAGHIGIRTRELKTKIVDSFVSGKSLRDLLNLSNAQEARKKISEDKAKEYANTIIQNLGGFNKRKKKKGEKEQDEDEQDRTDTKEKKESQEIIHLCREEIDAIDALLKRCAESGKKPEKMDFPLLQKTYSAADIAMFGRMVAKAPEFNTEAAVQVSHAITVHDVVVEEDYFTAVDDLNKLETDTGSAHIGVLEFAAGLYYIYICINRDLLIENLGGNKELASRAIAALTEACAKVAPVGKQASFASRAYASYLLVERGPQQPRSLAVAFIKPVKGEDILASAIETLENTRERIEKVYGKCCDEAISLNAVTGVGSLESILQFVAK